MSNAIFDLTTDMAIRLDNDGNLSITGSAGECCSRPPEISGYRLPEVHTHIESGSPEDLFAVLDALAQMRNRIDRLAIHLVGFLSEKGYYGYPRDQ